jgi:uncharacterized protein YdeI (YjbR/CyaY-like superfamily)
MEFLIFNTQKEYWDWLNENHDTSKGQFIRFDKTKETSELTADQALNVALCFGWIDSVIKRVDDQFYIKYFAKRTSKSIWSTKNKKTVSKLIKENLMMPSGYQAIEAAKKDGRWEQADLVPDDFSINDFTSLLEISKQAHSNYITFSPSIQKTYALSYYVLKKPESRQKRLKTIIERLEHNLKPM